MNNGKNEVEGIDVAKRNIRRAIHLVDQSMTAYFTGEDMKMARYYNPFTGERSSEIASIWMYGTSIEAVTSILKGLAGLKDKGYDYLYDQYFKQYVGLLKRLYQNADYYLGSYRLTSFTQTKEWTVYAVNRADKKGHADVTGVLNVYDDQMWLIRDYIEAYKITSDSAYLKKAEYLTAYVLDGWDTHRDSEGEEIGGIPWGPGYVTKHSCSNGPIISPLVWLHEFYKGRDDKIAHRYIDKQDKKTRRVRLENKSDYYLAYAKKIYDWQKDHLKTAKGVYDDMMGGCVPNCDVIYEIVNDVKYKRNVQLTERAGPPISYNSGTMLSGGADLYKATGNSIYLTDIKKLADAGFQYFAKLGTVVPHHYTYDVSGFNDWFNGVLLRGYKDVSSVYKKADKYIASFQDNLDYAYQHHLFKGFLPPRLLSGWEKDSSKNKVEGMFMFAFAAQYAILAQYDLNK